MSLMNEKDLIVFLTLKIAEVTDLPIDQIGPTENLEDLGLSSMDAVMISGDLEEHFDVEVEPMIMFENKTIKAIAEKIMLNEGA